MTDTDKSATRKEKAIRSDADQWQLQREMNAVTELRKSWSEVFEDEELVDDFVEGQTSLMEAVIAVMNSSDEDDILIEGIKIKQAELAERKARLEKRRDAKREMIVQAFEISEITKPIEAPTFTLSKRKVPPSVIITDEVSLPTKYLVQQPPKVDKRALLADLKVDGTEIPGATLSNGSISLQIRRK